MNPSLLRNTTPFPLIDGGVPLSAQLAGLGERFHYWLGVSGRRYLFTAIQPGDIADFDEAILVIAERTQEGRLTGRSVGVVSRAQPPALEPAADIVVFVHLLSATPNQRRSVLDDLLGYRSASLAA